MVHMGPGQRFPFNAVQTKKAEHWVGGMGVSVFRVQGLVLGLGP